MVEIRKNGGFCLGTLCLFDKLGKAGWELAKVLMNLLFSLGIPKNQYMLRGRDITEIDLF